MEHCICIHGHFYQPPRENPWLESIELQDSAHPYHDWNERINTECYEANTASRILDAQNRIRKIVNNYARISFNFGPTLLSWMEAHAPETYQGVIEADRESQTIFSGHGSAMAQAYNHVIMPLANRRDKLTQIAWGLRDFEHRFGRKPEGMWLPETAVDHDSLDMMAKAGIKFTVLAPHQARRVRPFGGKSWEDVSGSRIDPTMPYLFRLPAGRSIALFFYDGPVSRAIAFERLLDNGEGFVQRLLKAFSVDRRRDQIVHVATDGETYGHHHRFGDMALAYALNRIDTGKPACLTNYSQYLEKHPPTHEVEIFENTSWSCAHGVERWRSDCGCNTGANPGWNQSWRTPLRESLDWLRDHLARKYSLAAGELLKDPWAARNACIDIILDRSDSSLDAFLVEHAVRPLDHDERLKVLKLLEVQRHALLMYTSCGWFFDDISGIETVQVIQYAGRAVQLAEELFGDHIESRFLNILERSRSNIPERGDGRSVFEKYVRPAALDLKRLTAHYAISSLFEDYSKQTRVYCYQVDRQDFQTFEGGASRLAIGRVKVTSDITLESADMTFGVLHFGQHHVNAGVRDYRGDKAYRATASELAQAYSTADFPELLRLLDRNFGVSGYNLRSLLRDEQRKILSRILKSSMSDIESDYRNIHQRHYLLMRFLVEMGNPLPKPFHTAAEIVIGTDLLNALSCETPDPDEVRKCLEDAAMWKVDLDREGLGYVFTLTLERVMNRFMMSPRDPGPLRDLVGLARSMPIDTNLWRVQNLYFKMLPSTYVQVRKRAEEGDERAADWVAEFKALGEQLSIFLE